MDINSVLQHFRVMRQEGPNSWMCVCPAHTDTNASLHISLGDNGKILLKCFSGCAAHDIAAAAGLTMQDLFDDRLSSVKRQQGPRVPYGLTVAKYAAAKKLNVSWLNLWHVTDGQRPSKRGKMHPGVRIPYLDEHGKETAVRWRMVMQKDTGSNGEDLRFVWDKGNKTLLYGLWRIGEWPHDYVFVSEGESDTHSLWSAGFPAMAFPGAGNYKPERDDKWLQMFKVVYVSMEPDNGGKTLYKRLHLGGLKNIRLYHLDGAHKDPSSLWCAVAPEEFVRRMREAMHAAVPMDQFEKPAGWNWTAKDDEELANGLPDWPKQDHRAETSAKNGLQAENQGRPKTDYLGLVEAYADRLRDSTGALTLRFWRESWYRFDGRKYQLISDSDVENEIMAFLQIVEIQEAYNVQPSAQAMRNTMAGLRSMRYCGLPAALPAMTWISDGSDGSGWRAMANGLVDLEQASEYQLTLADGGGKADPAEVACFTRPLTADLLATTAQTYPYDPDADCPRFKQMLIDLQPDQAMRDMLQMMMGLCLVPETKYAKFWILYGNGGTGKSTFLRILKRVVGADNCCNVPLLDLQDKFSLWPLAERLVNIVEELQPDDKFGSIRYVEDRFKNMVSGGDIPVERKGRDRTEAKCLARHVFACNQLPVFGDRSDGLWDRMVIVPFEQRIRNTGKMILDFDQTLVDELPGILNFALVGLARLRRLDRFPEPEACLQAKAEHRDRCDQDSLWIRENFVRDDNPVNGWSFVSVAYDAYRKFLTANGLFQRTAVTFTDLVAKVYGIKATPVSRTDRRRRFVGLRFVGDQAQHPEEEHNPLPPTVDASDIPDAPF